MKGWHFLKVCCEKPFSSLPSISVCTATMSTLQIRKCHSSCLVMDWPFWFLVSLWQHSNVFFFFHMGFKEVTHKNTHINNTPTFGFKRHTHTTPCVFTCNFLTLILQSGLFLAFKLTISWHKAPTREPTLHKYCVNYPAMGKRLLISCQHIRTLGKKRGALCFHTHASDAVRW